MFVFGSFVFGLAVVGKVPQRRTVWEGLAKGFVCLCVCLIGSACDVRDMLDHAPKRCPEKVKNEHKYATCQPRGW